MQVYGQIKKIYSRDELTGDTFFTIFADEGEVPKNQEGNTVCHGILPPYHEGVCADFEGEVEEYKENKQIFTIQSHLPDCKTRAHAEDYLRSGEAGKLSDPVVAKIIDASDGKLFSFVEDKAVAQHVLEEDGVKPDVAGRVIESLRQQTAFAKLLKMVLGIGGSYSHAGTLQSVYGEMAARQFASHPYRGVYYGIPFSVCEAEGFEKKIPFYDEERVSALLFAAMTMGESSGNTCMTPYEIKRCAMAVEKRAGKGRETSMFFLAAAIVRESDRYMIDGGKHPVIYRKETYDNEHGSATDLLRIAGTVSEFPYESVSIEAIEKEVGITYAKGQRDAFSLFHRSGVKVLTGGPGTGKTTVVNGLIRFYEKMFPDHVIALCAPTANAAKRLCVSTGLNAVTVHKLLGVRPLGDTIVTDKDQYERLACNLLIVDEASMLDVQLLKMLLAALPDGATVLFVGDEDQLSSIGPGNVLHDLILVAGRKDQKRVLVSTCRLTEVYRQKGSSSIVENSVKIRNGEDELLLNDQTRLFRAATEEELAIGAVNLLVRSKKAGKSLTILTPVRSSLYPYGSVMLNKRAQYVLHGKDVSGALHCGDNLFLPGDPILMRRNNYDAGYINGDEGEVVSVYPERHSMIVSIDDKEIVLSGQNLVDADLNYAKTIHKSQGAEYDTCVIIVPQKPAGMLIRRMIYVAATRAKKQNIFLVEGNSFQLAVSNQKEHKRRTKLADFIEKGA